jgi:hypothetical protein
LHAGGDADAVRAVRLELRVNSRHGVQRALATLADDAGVLVERATGTAGVRLFELRFSLQ